MWLTCSSIGRKFVMALTGIALVLFVTFHVLMNAVAIFWPTAYNQICEFLGANWYALIASAGLALLFLIHIIYAVWLTLQNRAARGTDRYEVTTRPAQVEWSSKNMLVLGIVVAAFLLVHLFQFWAKMQLQEVLGTTATVDSVEYPAAFGTLFIQAAFSQWWTVVVYIIGFVALWFHFTHGFWSMFHTIGWNNNKWLKRLQCIGNTWATIVVGLFLVQAIVFAVQAKEKYYLTNEGLQEQYAEYWDGRAEATIEDFQNKIEQAAQNVMPLQRQEVIMNLFEQEGPVFIEKADKILSNYNAMCPTVGKPQMVNTLEQAKQQISSQLEFIQRAKADQARAQSEAQQRVQVQSTPEEVK